MSAPIGDLTWMAPDGNYMYDYSNNTWYEKGVDAKGNDTWVETSAPQGVTPPPEKWSLGDLNVPPSQPLPSGSGPTPPKVPGGDGKNNTSVDTPTLDLFASNIKSLIDPVTALIATLRQMTPVEPGAFYHADVIRANITGDNGDGGLRAKYLAVASDLGNGLTDLYQAIVTLSGKYKSIEDANKGTAEDIQRALDNTAPYFGGLTNDVGGGQSPPPA